MEEAEQLDGEVDGQAEAADDPRVEKDKAFGLLERYLSLHRFTIARKIALLMVDHFWETSATKSPMRTASGGQDRWWSPPAACMPSCC